VLVKRDGNRYTVLTAWHVVSGQRPGEELDIYTPDGQRHKLEQGSIKRLGEVDMAVLNFTSPTSYELARVGDIKSISTGSPIYVAGFPLATSAVNQRLLRFLKGDVVANATVAISNGYQLLYSNQTLPGMSGGAALNAQGQLVGIHGQGETDSQMSEQQGVAVKTGTNQAVPIAYYSQFASGAPVVSSASRATSADDYLAQARALSGKKGREREVIVLSSQALSALQSAEAYFYRAYAKSDLGDQQGAIADLNQAIAINPQDAVAYYNRGAVKHKLGDKQAAIADYNQAIAINPQYAGFYYNRGNVKYVLGDKQAAIADYNQAIAINPQYAEAYNNRGNVKKDLGDKQAAIADYSQAIAINPQLWMSYLNRGTQKAALSDIQGAIDDYSQALAINPRNAEIYANVSFNLGNFYILLNQPDKAMPFLEQAEKLLKDFWEPINNQGLLLWEADRRQDAMERWQRVLKINPDGVETSLAMATGLFVTSPEFRGEALGLAEKVLAADPKYVLDSYQKEMLWGDKLRAETRRLLSQHELMKAVDRANAKLSLYPFREEDSSQSTVIWLNP
jgi:tetratricopeptide (TPR) repeat protein